MLTIVPVMPDADYDKCKYIKLNGANSDEQGMISVTLTKIWQKQLGKDFFAAIALACEANGRKIVVRYRQNSGNSCAAWSAAQYIKMVQERGSEGDSKMGRRFETALNAAITDGKTLGELAAKLYRMKTPSLLESQCKGDSPLRDITPGPGVLSSTESKFSQWKNAGALGREKSDVYECVLLLLEDYWEPGDTTNASIVYDDTKLSLGGKARPIAVSLFHELTHAYYAVQGKQLGIESPPSATNTLYEGMCVGLAPHHQDRPYSENKCRAAFNTGLRKDYKY